MRGRGKRKDNNHVALFKHAESLGFMQLDLSMVPRLVDAVWLRAGRVFFVEIKNPENKSYGMQPHQQELKRRIEAHGGVHVIIQTEQDVNNIFRTTL